MRQQESFPLRHFPASGDSVDAALGRKNLEIRAIAQSHVQLASVLASISF